jgi:hypothetical protein
MHHRTPTNFTAKLRIQPTMQANATALISILYGALVEIEENPVSHAPDISTSQLRNSILLAIDELELARTGSHQLQAA